MTLNMAAIAARSTRQQRERSKSIVERNWKNIETSKSLYILPPFDPHFDPTVHNKFIRNKVKNEADMKLYRCCEKFLDQKKMELRVTKITKFDKIFEILILGISEKK